jgi:hypothetical protein
MPEQQLFDLLMHHQRDVGQQAERGQTRNVGDSPAQHDDDQRLVPAEDRLANAACTKARDALPQPMTITSGACLAAQS